MSPVDFDSEQEMRYLLEGLKNGIVSPVTCYEALCRATLYTLNRAREPGAQAPSEARRLEAFVLDLPDSGRHLAFFLNEEEAMRHAEKLEGRHTAQKVLAGLVMAGLPSGVGVIVNPGNATGGFRLTGAGLEKLRRDFGIALPPPQNEPATGPEPGGYPPPGTRLQ
jgi:hypothetical protein